MVSNEPKQMRTDEGLQVAVKHQDLGVKRLNRVILAFAWDEKLGGKGGAENRQSEIG